MALDEIVDYKKALVSQRSHLLPSIKSAIRPTNKSLYKALMEPKKGFICEVKFASPSKGPIREGISALQVARHYEPFASAISVLADEKYFGGSYDVVRQVAESVSCPVLCKDVVVSPQQVYEARYHGADCVLLMLSVLEDQDFQECARVAASLNMDFIAEVHTEQEMHRANKLHAPIIGINNRNLKTLAIDMETSARLAPMAHANARIILESGFSKHEHIHRYASLGHGFLVGSSLMASPRIDLALRELIFGRVKICGITNVEDAHKAYQQGAYYGGLNFAEVSKRCITVEESRSIIASVPLVFGGVFVNQPQAQVADTVNQLGLKFAQLHGDENQHYIDELRAMLDPSCELWRAFRVKDTCVHPSYRNVDHVVLDQYSPHDFGGTGQSFDWNMLQKDSDLAQIIVAGGINPNNVRAAANLLPFALDIASGVEDADPRKKSPHKLEALFYELRP